MTKILVTPESDLKFSDLKIQRSNYAKTRSTHLPGIMTHANDEEGIIYTVDDEDDEVMHITYLPTARDCQSLINDQPFMKPRSSRRDGVLFDVETTRTQFFARVLENARFPHLLLHAQSRPQTPSCY
jgi:hypothetical protein